jgi:6-phosphogluconolactonase
MEGPLSDAAPAGEASTLVVDDVPVAFAKTVADAFAARVGERFSLVLSGGETAKKCYEELAHTDRYPIDWDLVDVYIGDERCVPPDDPDANQRLVRESLLEAVGGARSFHPMSCPDGPAAFEEVIREAGDFLDLVHLGLGPDGHTASLFPEVPELDVGPEKLVAMTTDPAGRNPHPRMTLTLPGITRARLVVFTVEGEEKAWAYRSVNEGADLPAARVRASSILWIVDHAAAGG